MKEYEGTGILARAFEHEIDHLDGVLFTDKMVERVEYDEDGHDGEEPEDGDEL
jgi:peptide deformylase